MVILIVKSVDFRRKASFDDDLYWILSLKNNAFIRKYLVFAEKFIYIKGFL